MVALEEDACIVAHLRPRRSCILKVWTCAVCKVIMMSTGSAKFVFIDENDSMRQRFRLPSSSPHARTCVFFLFVVLLPRTLFRIGFPRRRRRCLSPLIPALPAPFHRRSFAHRQYNAATRESWDPDFNVAMSIAEVPMCARGSMVKRY